MHTEPFVFLYLYSNGRSADGHGIKGHQIRDQGAEWAALTCTLVAHGSAGLGTSSCASDFHGEIPIEYSHVSSQFGLVDRSISLELPTELSEEEI